MVGNTWKPDRAKQYRVIAADDIQAVLRHHASCLRVIFAAPWLLAPREPKPKLDAAFFKHGDTGAGDFPPDPSPGMSAIL